MNFNPIPTTSQATSSSSPSRQGTPFAPQAVSSPISSIAQTALQAHQLASFQAPQSMNNSSNSTQLNSQVQMLLDDISHIQAQVRSEVEDKQLLLVVGNTGAGKSTLLNYMTGKTFQKQTTALGNTIVTCQDPIFEIGHTRLSHTFVPQIHFDNQAQLSFCDCPGFFDNRGPAIELANATSLRTAATSCSKVNGLVLCIEYASLISMRGADMDNAINRTLEFLGIGKNYESLFVMITQVENRYLLDPSGFFDALANLSPVLKELHQRGNLGCYSPFDDLPTHPRIFKRDTLMQKIQSLPSIAKSPNTFRLALSPDAQSYLDWGISLAQKKIVEVMSSKWTQQSSVSLGELMSCVSALRNIADTSMAMDQQFTKLKDAIEVQIKLLGNSEETAYEETQKELEEMQGILPKEFSPLLKKVLEEMKGRHDRKKNFDAALNSAQDKLKENEKMLDNLKKDLEQNRISQAEFKKKAEELEANAKQLEQKQQHYRDQVAQERRQTSNDACEQLNIMKLLLGAMQQQPQIAPAFPMMGGGMSMGPSSCYQPVIPSSNNARAGQVWVRPYTRTNGTQVSGHWRRK